MDSKVLVIVAAIAIGGIWMGIAAFITHRENRQLRKEVVTVISTVESLQQAIITNCKK